MVAEPLSSRKSVPGVNFGAWLLRGAIALLALGVLLGIQKALDLTINDYVVQIMILAGINVTLAVSLNLINGITGQFSLGHAGFMAVGAYVSAYFARDIGPGLHLSDAAAFLVSLLLAALAAGVMGYLVGLPSLRLRGDYLAIVTLGFGQIITSVLNTVKFAGGTTFIDNVPKNTSFAWAFGAAALCVLMVRNIADSSLGRAMRAVREDEIAAEAAGVNTTGTKVTAFVISAAWAGVAGGLFAGLQGIAHPNDYSFVRSVEIVVMVVLGGLGSITGATLAALLLSALQEALRVPSVALIVAVSLIVLAAALSLPRHRARAAQNAAALGTTPAPSYIVAWLAWPVVSLAAVLALWILGRDFVEANVALLRYIIFALILIVLMLLRPQGLLGRAEFSLRGLRRRKSEAPNRPSAPADEGISGAL